MSAEAAASGQQAVAESKSDAAAPPSGAGSAATFAGAMPKEEIGALEFLKVWLARET